MATVLAPARPTVPRLWPGSTVVCLGTGPSLTTEDVAYVRGKARVIAVNDAVTLAPDADVLYACDFKWWHWHRGAPAFQGLKFALTKHAERYPGVTVLRNTGDTGLERDPSGLKTGKNSGYQAINLAVHLGAARVILLGYDMTATGRKGGHFFGAHPDQSMPPFALCLRHFASLVAPLATAGVEVLNCTRQTALTVFPQPALEAVL
jgi:hypothetical protein